MRKIDYYLYSTRTNGFDEWLLDQDQEPYNGATAFVASADFLPCETSEPEPDPEPEPTPAPSPSPAPTPAPKRSQVLRYLDP